jgi:hypothetical protein
VSPGFGFLLRRILCHDIGISSDRIFFTGPLLHLGPPGRRTFGPQRTEELGSHRGRVSPTSPSRRVQQELEISIRCADEDEGVGVGSGVGGVGVGGVGVGGDVGGGSAESSGPEAGLGGGADGGVGGGSGIGVGGGGEGGDVGQRGSTCRNRLGQGDGPLCRFLNGEPVQ